MSDLLKEYYPFENDALPTGWAEVPIGAIAGEIQSGFSSGKSTTDAIGIPHLRPMNVTPNGTVTLEDVRYVSPFTGELRLKDDDILFTNTSSTVWVGKTGVVKNPDNWAFSNHMTRIHLAEGMLPEFFAKQLHYLCRCGFFAHHCTEHVNQSSIAPRLLRDRIPIRVPPAAEQIRILKRLEELQAQGANARKHLAEIPLQLAETRQSILNSAFSGTLTAHWRKQNNTRKLPWEEFSFAELFPDLTQGWSPRCDPVPAKTNEWGVIKTTAIQPMRFDPSQNKRLPKNLMPIAGLSIRAGDILFTRAGPRSRCGVSTLVPTTHSKLIVCDKAYRLRVDETKAIPDFVAQLLNSPTILRRLDAMKTGASENGMNITQKRFLEITHLIPPLREQHEIVRNLDTALKQLNAAVSSHNAALIDLDHFDEALLARAFRGQLVEQKTAEESATLFVSHFAAQPKPPRIRMRRKAKSSTKSQVQSILALLSGSNTSILSPEDLFRLTGHDEGDLEHVEGFYAELRQLLKDGKVKEHRPDSSTVTLSTTQ